VAGHHECLPSASHTRYDDAIEFIDGHAGTDGRTRLIVERRASARDIFAADRNKVLAEPGISDRARDYTIGRIERRLADALDTPATEQEGA
jgi:hypothetical protein